MYELPPTLATAAQIGVPVIEVSHVSTRFGTAVVHRDVSLTVVRGEVFAIAGGNEDCVADHRRPEDVVARLADAGGPLIADADGRVDRFKRPVQFHDPGGKRGGAAS